MEPSNPQDKELIKLFERGKYLYDLTFSPGWDVLLDMMESIVAESEANLFNSISTDPQVIVAYQKRANAYRAFFHRFQLDVNEAIRVAREVPLAATQNPLPGADETIEGLDKTHSGVVY